MRGLFITLEGIDGAGKSTHLQWLADRFRTRGRVVTTTREPGGTPVGEALRQVLLSSAHSVHPETEALIVFAARREHLERVILPALEADNVVLCDRFTDATFAYQGGGRGVSDARLEVLERWVQGDLEPNLTLFFDVPVELGRQRVDQGGTLDRFERERNDFFERVRAAYRGRAARHAARFRVIDGSMSLDEIRKELEKIVIRY